MSKLVSDGSVTAVTTDSNLINPWGIAFSPTGPVWVANNGTQTSTLYDGTGVKQALTVAIPPGVNGAADPTGIVFNGTTDFAVTQNATTAPALFILSGEGGTISGWAPSVNLGTSVVVYDDAAGGAVYKGLALANNGSGNFLYATDFHNNKIDVFDTSFAKVTTTGGFTDSTLPAGYAPFGIQALQIQTATAYGAAGTVVLVVTYAKQDSNAHDDTNGAGLGMVNIFDTHGTLQKHLVATGGALNAPWGVALAPSDFGTLSGDLLIGNFGDGVINAYDSTSGSFIGSVNDTNGTPIANPGLWGLSFGNGAQNQPLHTLYFAAGIAQEAAGLYGRIDLGATAPDIVAPTVALSAPAAGTVSGTVAVTATAADNVGVTQVKFFAGTTAIGTATTAPFTVNWDTTTAINGAVNLTAQASDAAGNLTTSAPVAVTVTNNAAPVVTLTQLQASIFTPICSTCHTGNGGGLPGVMNLTSAANSFANLVGVASIEVPSLNRVTAGDPDNSYIIKKLEGTQTSGSRMPLGGPFLDQATINQVRAWIQAGALNN